MTDNMIVADEIQVIRDAVEYITPERWRWIWAHVTDAETREIVLDDNTRRINPREAVFMSQAPAAIRFLIAEHDRLRAENSALHERIAALESESAWRLEKRRMGASHRECWDRAGRGLGSEEAAYRADERRAETHR